MVNQAVFVERLVCMPSSREPAALLRLGKIRRCLAQNLIGLAQLAILMLQRLHLFALGSGQALAQIPVPLGLPQEPNDLLFAESLLHVQSLQWVGLDSKTVLLRKNGGTLLSPRSPVVSDHKFPEFDKDGFERSQAWPCENFGFLFLKVSIVVFNVHPIP